MKSLLFIFSVMMASPENGQKCEITCSGIADNFSQYPGDNHVLVLKGKSLR